MQVYQADNHEAATVVRDGEVAIHRTHEKNEGLSSVGVVRHPSSGEPYLIATVKMGEWVPSREEMAATMRAIKARPVDRKELRRRIAEATALDSDRLTL